MSLQDRLGEAKEEVCAVGRWMLDSGLVAGSWGNVSLRFGDLMLITPSGMDYDVIVPEDIVAIDLVTDEIDGHRNPSSEAKMHKAVYWGRVDVRAIVHTHSVYAGVLAVTHTPLPPILEDLAQITGGTIEVADYALAGSLELAGNVAKSLADKGAVLLANHGLVTVGRNLEEAMYTALLVERAAKVYVLAGQVGTAKILPASDVSALRENYLKQYRKI
ncbi:MAG TPA: class II aldolase/adducin family protein [Clostridia bacterium]|nr:class II aldolase/adducin family protein [Clostridia bacterium]